MYAGLSESAVVDTPSALSAPPMARARAFGISPKSYACSGDVDIDCASAERVAAIVVNRLTTATACPDLRTGANLTAPTGVDQFSASGPLVHDAGAGKTPNRRLLTRGYNQNLAA